MREILMTPGPVTVPSAILKELSRPLIFHRYVDFQELYQRLIKQLHRVFKGSSKHKCVIFTGSGTSANEAILSSAFDRKDKVLVISNGDFGERLGTILKLHGVPVSLFRLKPFRAIDPGEVAKKALVENVTAVAMVAMETSTGIVNPVKDLGVLLRKQTRNPIAFFVDAVSALGCEPMDMKEWGVSYCTSVPNKAIEAPPGISFACINTSEYFKRKRAPTSYYLDLSRYLISGETSQTPTTPALPQLAALSKALQKLTDETLSARRARYQALTDQLIIKLETLGFLPCVPTGKNRSAAVTAFAIPTYIQAAKLNRFLRKEGFVVWFPPTREGSIRGEIMLTSVMGSVRKSHVRGLVHAIEKFADAS